MSGFKYCVALDIGGTNLRGTWLDFKGRRDKIFLKKRPQNLSGTKHALTLLIQKIIARCPEKPGIIAVASAGPLDVQKKCYLKTVNMPELDFFPIGSFLEEKFSLPVLLENDAQAAALGEVTYGCLQGEDFALVITLGTGVGTGVILDRKIWRAGHVTGPELGHIFLGGEELCGCGQQGCAETLLNKRALLALATKYGLTTTSVRTLINIGQQDKQKFIRLLQDYGARLGLFIAQLQVMLGLKNICICGGLAHFARLSHKFMRATLEKRLSQRSWWLPDTIKYSSNPDLSALLGMLSLATKQY
ncbi:MAG: ROK family protein [Desulfonauticus sp.]|nr:ROK family protein [Desulfonauticus sp.]